MPRHRPRPAAYAANNQAVGGAILTTALGAATRRGDRRRPRRRDRRCLGRRPRHGGRRQRFRLCANVAAAAIRRHVCPVHERARQHRARLLAAARRPALCGARPAALRGSAGFSALRSRGLSRRLSRGIPRSAGSAAPGYDYHRCY